MYVYACFSLKFPNIILTQSLLFTFLGSASTIITYTTFENPTPTVNMSHTQATVTVGNYSVSISSTQRPLPSHCHRVCVCSSSEGEYTTATSATSSKTPFFQLSETRRASIALQYYNCNRVTFVKNPKR